jgi:hypothetical protein
LPVPERAHAGDETLVPERVLHRRDGVQVQGLLLGEVLEVADALEAVHVIAVHVRHEDVVDAEEVEHGGMLRSCLVARRPQHAAVGVGTIDRKAEAVGLEQEGVGEVFLRERVADAEDIELHGRERSAVW